MMEEKSQAYEEVGGSQMVTDEVQGMIDEKQPEIGEWNM